MKPESMLKNRSSHSAYSLLFRTLIIAYVGCSIVDEPFEETTYVAPNETEEFGEVSKFNIPKHCLLFCHFTRIRERNLYEGGIFMQRSRLHPQATSPGPILCYFRPCHSREWPTTRFLF